MEAAGIYRDSASGSETPCKLVIADDLLNIYPESGDLMIWKIPSLFIKQNANSRAEITYKPLPGHSVLTEGPVVEKLLSLNLGIEKPVVPKSTVKRSAAFLLLLVIVLIVSVVMLIWFYFIPWVGEKAAAMVPVEAELRLGEQLSSVYGNEIIPNDSAGIYIQKFVEALQFDRTYPIRVKVIRSDEINAFAVPGGHIFVYSGIIKKMHSHRQLVALLGHEMSHVQKRHSLKSICRSAAAGIMISGVLGDVSGISSAILSEADRFKELDYSRDLETEADNEGLKIMQANGVDPKGMLELLELLKKESGETPALMKYLSTHPDTEARIKNVAGQLGAETGTEKVNAELEHYFSALQNAVKK